MRSRSLSTPVLLLAASLFMTGCGVAAVPASPTPVASAQVQTQTTPAATEPPASTPTSAKTFTLTDVATHGTDADCWLVIRDKVYDVTNFEAQHPGGKAALVAFCGKDATTAFETRPDGPGTPHPSRAEQMLAQLYVGDLKR